MLKKVSPIMCSYIVATLSYLVFITKELAGTNDYNILIQKLFSFSASSPLYFIEYYLAFTLLSPIIFAFIVQMSKHKSHNVSYFCLTCITFCIGYFSVGYLHFLGGSYLAIYTIGMLWGYNDCHFWNKKVLAIIGIVFLVFGLLSTKMFYFNRVAGHYYPSGIDKIVPKLSMPPLIYQ